MGGRSTGKGTAKCPYCSTAVRRDRWVLHLRDVHPGKKVEPVPEATGPTGKGRRSAPPGPHIGPLPGSWKMWASVAALLVVLVLVGWVLLRPAPVPSQAKVGSPAPNFSFTELSGSSTQLSSYEGHPIVLWWVATYCSTCGQGTQLFAQNYATQYRSSGVTLLEVESYNDLGQPGPSLSSFASQNGYAASPLWVLGAGSSGGTTTYNPDSYMDAYYVINSGGTVIDTGTNLPASFPAALQEALGT